MNKDFKHQLIPYTTHLTISLRYSRPMCWCLLMWYLLILENSRSGWPLNHPLSQSILCSSPNHRASMSHKTDPTCILPLPLPSAEQRLTVSVWAYTNRWLVQHGRSSNLGRASFVSSLFLKKKQEREREVSHDPMMKSYTVHTWVSSDTFLQFILLWSLNQKKQPHEVIIHNPTHFLSVVTSSERYDGYVVFAPCSSCFCFFVFFEMSWKHMYCTYWWSRVAGAVMCVGRVDIRRRLS